MDPAAAGGIENYTPQARLVITQIVLDAVVPPSLEQQNMDLKHTATEIRINIIKELLAANSGHTAGPLGAADIFTALYFGDIVKYDPKNPTIADRDRVVVSAGHYSPVVYATLAKAGFFPEDELKTFRHLNSRLQGHVHNITTPGIENSGGPLGQGYSTAVGMALAARMDNAPWHVYCFSSDGEHNEGQTWEAIMWAGNHKLDSLTVILDKNNIQIDGPNDKIAPIDPIKEKYKAFNWHTIEIDGNNIDEVIGACKKAKAHKGSPTVIIAKTIPGKGVSFMENDFKWHGIPPKPDQGEKALAELQRLL